MTEENLQLTTKQPKEKIRFKWLDEFRGIVILLFVIQTVAWTFSGKPAEGLAPVVAPWLNHGWKYAEYENIAPMITLIDIGQQIFIFLVGFMQAFSIAKGMTKNQDQKTLWIHVIKRFVLVLVLSAIHIVGSGDIDARSILLTGTLANIAWAGLAAGIVSIYLPEPDTRLYLGIGLLTLHMILYATVQDFPFQLLGHMAIAVVASAYTLWFFTPEGQMNPEKIKTRVLPISTYMFIACYITSFIEFADHHDVTTPLSLMAIATSGFMIFIFYKVDEAGYEIPGLRAIGLNMLLIFILSMVVNELVYIPMIEDLVRVNPFTDLLLAGILPILFMWIIAKILEHFNIVFKV